MKRQVYRYEYHCDRCPVTVTVETADDTPPPGWRRVKTHGWGLTNYSRDEDLCPECSKEWKVR